MRLTHLLILLFLLFPFLVNSQSLFETKIKSRVSCQDASEYANEIIPKYIENAQTDSLQLFIRYWDKKCGSNSTIRILDELISLEKGDFDSKIISNEYLEELLKLNAHHSPSYYYSRFLNEETAPSDKISASIVQWAKRILSSTQPCSDQYGILLIRANMVTEFFQWANKPCHSSLKIPLLYSDAVIQNQSLTDTDVGFILEFWHPTDHNISVLGNRFGVGMYVGEHFKRFEYQGTMIIRFLNTPEKYFVRADGKQIQTKHFFGGYFGVDVGYALIKKPEFRIYALGGIGYDGFSALKNDYDKDDEPTKSINSLNLNSGVGLRFGLPDQSYIGIESRYNRVNYINRRGTDLSGNVITLRLIAGGFLNYRKKNNLDKLNATWF